MEFEVIVSERGKGTDIRAPGWVGDCEFVVVRDSLCEVTVMTE